MSKKWYFNIFVEKLLKKKWKLLSMEQIEKMSIDSMWEQYSRPKGYKLIHLAKNRDILVSLKKDLFYVRSEITNDLVSKISEEELENQIIEKRYWQILHDHIKKYMDWNGLITGADALNLMLNNYEIPDTITIISNDKQCVQTVIWNKKVAIKKVYNGKDSLFKLLKKSAQKIQVRNKSFFTTSLSISLLEALYATGEDSPVTIELCKRVLRRQRKQLDRDEIVFFLRKWKYHTSMNKLYKIARGIDEKYAQHIMEIIKKHSYRISL